MMYIFKDIAAILPSVDVPANKKIYFKANPSNFNVVESNNTLKL